MIRYNDKRFNESTIDYLDDLITVYGDSIGIDYTWYKLNCIISLKWYKLFKSLNIEDSAKDNLKWFIQWNRRAVNSRVGF